MSIVPEKLRLYWHTARHLRPSQIYRRAWFHAVHPKVDLRPHPSLQNSGTWAVPARRRQSQFATDEFSFLNEKRSLSQNGWDDTSVAKLWRYNLHYFDDLNADQAEERASLHGDLICRWIAENPPGRGSGWEPYPTSLRVVNWIKWARRGNRLSENALHSLAVQTRWLARRLEYHLLGNHLFTNAKALVFAGHFFAGDEADRWLRLGRRILAREIPEQILPDGGHFELSPMYHALALEDMLDLVNIERSAAHAVPLVWYDKIAAMRTWLAAMTHPDGEIAFFNDAAIGIAPAPFELERYATELGFKASTVPECHVMRDSGYVRLQDARAVALLDAARIGPDYLPGHAHADTLSFELSVGKRRVIVNSGTSVYGSGPERLRQRGTAAHNTVELDNQDSSEVWSGFRVARRAYPQGFSVERDGDGWNVTCSHDGYSRLPGRPRHSRTWRFANNALTICDSIKGSLGAARAAFHFHPAFIPSLSPKGGEGTLCDDQGNFLIWRIKHGTAEIQPSTWHPEFGMSIPSQKLVLTLSGGEGEITFSWGE